MMKRNIFVLSLFAGFVMPVAAQQDSIGIDFVDQVIEVGANKDFTRAQSTAAVSVITNRDVNKRSAKNIGNSILGQGNGLVSIQGSGTYFEQNPTFYVRGLQSLSTSAPLILVDGVERDISIVSPEEVDHVSILKDAAAVALYGYKGANGAVLITTKRGEYRSQNVRVSYDHLFNFQSNRPKFVDGATFASALNEALANEGSSPRFSQEELAAFKSGNYPYQYPNVNWVDETFRKNGVTNKIGVEFSGGGERFRYFTMVNLLSDKGFIKNSDETEGYSTQDKYVRGNLRTNLDIDLTPTTMLKVNMLGMLSEMSRPGGPTSTGSSSSTAVADLWDMVYSTPAIAFPIKNENDEWGGSSTYSGVNNPVAESSGAAYYKLHERALFTDMTLNQDLKYWVEGLSLTARLGYDTYSTLYEDHSMTYVYGNYPVTEWLGGTPVLGDYWSSGTPGTMSKNSGTVDWSRRLIFSAGLNFDRLFADKHYVYSQLKWDYEYQNTTGSTGYTVYRQNYSWLGHYGFDNRYIGEVALVYSGSNRLAPGTKWNLSPTISGAWVISNENFLKDSSIIDFLKMRASFGIINADYLPGDNVWNYYAASYSQGSSATGSYPFGSGYDVVYANTTLGLLPTLNPSHEKAYKYNLGFDARLFGGLNVELDLYMQQRKDIWVEGSGAYTALIGFDAPYINAGKVDSKGFELSLDYTKTLGELTFNVGGMFNYNKNEIKDMAEEPRAYDNLVRTGNPLNSTYGLVAIGLFKDQADIDASPKQNFSTVYPGDIKYLDVNKDGVIDANDTKKIGYSGYAPEIFYNAHAGVEYKGFGIDLLFQGVGNYSANLNAKGMYWPLLNTTNLSQQAYDGRWTTSNPDAKFPRLSTTSNANNYQTSTFWQRDRSFLKLRNVELYYNLPKTLLEQTRIIKNAKVYVRGTDLFCADHLDEADPESYGVSAPLNKSIVAGVALSF
ncbi:MAG: SusC/RagA family TonB-linked outer membrane protein [Prevotella sp.]|nr:SusC/RagA family TonB-linked outer membrane protein [Prevotella sp.]